MYGAAERLIRQVRPKGPIARRRWRPSRDKTPVAHSRLLRSRAGQHDDRRCRSHREPRTGSRWSWCCSCSSSRSAATSLTMDWRGFRDQRRVRGARARDGAPRSGARGGDRRWRSALVDMVVSRRPWHQALNNVVVWPPSRSSAALLVKLLDGETRSRDETRMAFSRRRARRLHGHEPPELRDGRRARLRLSGDGLLRGELPLRLSHRAPGRVRHRRCSRPASRSSTSASGSARSVSLAVVLFVFQYLLRAGIQAYERGEELEKRTRELASLQVGLINTVLQTLSMRDAMTARHSAAVARYAREVARLLGLSEREQELIHTAGLFHDIGKFIFPDSILIADRKLTDGGVGDRASSIPSRAPSWSAGSRAMARSPTSCSATTRRSTAPAIPYGLSGEHIPLGSRILAAADTYDVMTARDSYRNPVSSEEALAELRRVCRHPARPAGRRRLRRDDRAPRRRRSATRTRPTSRTSSRSSGASSDYARPTVVA